MNILEAKLSSEHRNELPDSEFGLPKDRKYPLNDESHVRSAINFFKYAKPNQRRELAKNINLKLKKFDMKIKVTEDNPFYKYIDRKYLAESTCIEDIITESSFTYVKGTNSNETFDNYVYNLMIKSERYVDEEFILETEREVYNILKNNTDTTDSLLRFLYDINNVFEIIYAQFLKYKQYDTNVNMASLYYPLINDFRKSFMMKIMTDDKCVDMGSLQKEYAHFIGKLTTNNFEHNWFCINRINAEVYFNILNQQSRGIDFVNLDLKSFQLKLNPTYHLNEKIDIDCWVEGSKDLHLISVGKMLREKKNYIENEIYIITKNIDTSLMDKQKFYSLYSIDNKKIMEKIDSLSYILDSTDRFGTILKNISFMLTQTDQERLIHTKYIRHIISSKYHKGKVFWFGTDEKEENLYIICKDLTTDNVVYKLVLVDDNCDEYLRQVHAEKPKVKILTITFPIDNDIDFDLEQVTEGLSINENGDIKITINPKKSYMEEYAEAHRILVENYKNNNYEAMKQNVAFMFLLISIIEKDNRYKRREPAIVKARAFAINDFKTYLSYIQKKEPNFNFENYYKQTELDKYIVNIPKETILGIKTLLKNILM